MPVKSSLLRPIVAVTITSVLLIAGARADAQQRPARQRAFSRGAADPVSPKRFAVAGRGDRVLYGRIDAIRGRILYVLCRGGRQQRIDASEALRTDTFSQPLFVGKIVVVDGFYDAARTLHAASVMAMQSLDAGTERDR
jgi:hypothetical protein